TVANGVDTSSEFTIRPAGFGLAVAGPYSVVLEVMQPLDGATRTATFGVDASMAFTDGQHTCNRWQGSVTWVPGFSIEVKADCLDSPNRVDAFFASQLPGTEQ